MKKTFLRTIFAVSAMALMVTFSSCKEKENEPVNNNNNTETEEEVSVETPRSLVIGSDGNLYVTCYYPRCVARFDLAKKKFTGLCNLGNYQPEGIAEIDNKLYIASGYITDENNNYLYDNKLYIVDIDGFKLVDSVTVGRNPNKVKKLDDSHIVFNTLGNYADDQGGTYVMDVTNKEIVKLDVTLYNFDVYNGEIYGYTNIYGADPLSFFKIDGSNHQASPMGITWTASDNPYGIAVNPNNGDIIVTSDGSYTATGDCYVFNNDGSVRSSGINVGNLPSKIAAISSNLLIVLNEGAWGANNASVSKVDVAAGTADNRFFDNANGRGLGDVAQDLLLNGGNAYIAVSFSNSVEIMDITNGKSDRYSTTK